jgi:hypothetical protein
MISTWAKEADEQMNMRLTGHTSDAAIVKSETGGAPCLLVAGR